MVCVHNANAPEIKSSILLKLRDIGDAAQKLGKKQTITWRRVLIKKQKQKYVYFLIIQEKRTLLEKKCLN